MRFISFLRSSAAALALLLPAGMTAAAPASDALKTGFDPAPAVDALRQTIKNAGGDPEGQAIHLILGFATGNMANDPVGAGAMRQVGQQLLNRFLAAGDTVTALGFEKDVWTSLEPWSQPFDPQRKETYWRQWPATAAPDTVGGSDYSRALVRILGKVSRTHSPGNYVVVLLGDYDLAQAPYHGVPADSLSEKSSLFRDALAAAGATPLVRAASFPFTQRRGSSAQRSIWMLVATPQHFVAPTLAGGARSSLISSNSWYPADDPYAPRASRSDEAASRNAAPTWPIPVLIALLLALVVWWRIRGFGQRPLVLTLTSPGEKPLQWQGPFGSSLIARLVGAGYPDDQVLSHDVPIGTRGGTLPQPLMELRGARRAVKLVPLAASLSVDGAKRPAGATLGPGAARTVTLSGQFQPAVGGPTLPFSIQLELKLA